MCGLLVLWGAHGYGPFSFLLVNEVLRFVSVLPLCSAFIVFVFLISFFLWFKVGLFLSLFFLSSLLLPGYVFEVSILRDRRPWSFVIFLFSEAMVFVSLFVVTLWYEDVGVWSISDWFGIPLVGCLLLISSSLAITVYHGWFCCEVVGCRYLKISIWLGVGFVLLQLWEMWECCCDVTFCSYYSAAFSTVGLHFLHVILGLFILFYLLKFADSLSSYYVTFSIWYWHFVDYIWLLVFLVVYVV